MIAGMILFQALSSDWKQVAFQREASELDG
jgi:hypothetical protein